MTVYTGDIKAAISFLQSTVDATPDFEKLSATDAATLKLAAQQLQEQLSSAIATQDADTSPGGLSGAALAAPGAFPLDTAQALLSSIANSAQQSVLLSIQGYVGRVQINLGVAG